MPNTIAENLQRLVDAKADIADAITAKGGTVNTGDGFEEFPDDIRTIPSGGGVGGDSGKPVRFIDYDCTVVASYTAEEFAQLTAMPPNPTHAGLTAQGWNWSLSDAQSYVAANGMLDVGQMYITSDGKTRLYITLQDGRLSPVLKLYLSANTEVDVDWGDGTAHSTWTATNAGYNDERHNYAASGDYVIAVTITTGSIILQSSSTSMSTLLTNGNNSTSSPDRAYLNSIQKVEIGGSVTSIGQQAFNGCSSLASVTIPDSVTSIGTGAFQSCYSLASVTIPDSVTSIGNYAFNGCSSLASVTIPDSVTSIGQQAFNGCSSLASVTIPDSVTSIGQYAFQSCYSLASVTIPDSVTSIGKSAFQSCYSLASVTIPDSVTSIGNYAFNGCSSLASVTIPDSVTSIGQYAFQSCSSIGSLKFEKSTPPTAGSNAFANIPTDCTIYVPTGSLSAYQSASNYPNPSTYTYVEY